MNNNYSIVSLFFLYEDFGKEEYLRRLQKASQAAKSGDYKTANFLKNKALQSYIQMLRSPQSKSKHSILRLLTKTKSRTGQLKTTDTQAIPILASCVKESDYYRVCHLLNF